MIIWSNTLHNVGLTWKLCWILKSNEVCECSHLSFEHVQRRTFQNLSWIYANIWLFPGQFSYPSYGFYLLLFVFLLWEELDSVFSITMQQVMENRNNVSPQSFPLKAQQTHPSTTCLHAVHSSPLSRLLATAELTLVCPWFSFTEDPQTRHSNPDVGSQMPKRGEGSPHRPPSYSFPVCGWPSWAKDHTADSCSTSCHKESTDR